MNKIDLKEKAYLSAASIAKLGNYGLRYFRHIMEVSDVELIKN
jgi:hypothetical protein